MSKPMVDLVDLEKRFGHATRPALAGISAQIQSGIVTGLVGPDGAGKTTLMRLIAGLMLPSSGTVKLHTIEPSDTNGNPNPVNLLSQPSQRVAPPGAVLEPNLREFIGYMPQRFGLYEDLSVQENLELHADLRGVIGEDRKQSFEHLLGFTDLTRFTSRLAGKLSGGMKQKLGLACALLGQPRLLLLDEPGVGVDPISRRELWKMVHELIDRGLTVIWSTAYLDEAELCGEVLLLNEGHLLFSGKPVGLTNRMRDRCLQVRNIAGNRRQLLARALRLPQVMDGVIQGHSVRLVLRPQAPELPLQALDAGPEAQTVRVPPRFEDAFIDVLGGGPGGDSVVAEHVDQIQGDHETVVEAIELTRKFGEFLAADRVSFAVKRAEIFGLLGPNGAGKSTTFRMLCGLLPPTSGTARVMGLSLANSPSQARQHLGYMAQKFSLYGNLTVQQNLRFFSGAYGLRGSRQTEMVNGMIEVFKLQPFLKTSPDTLPLGFKQRLALACALMHHPDILFLDEPTSGVDPVTRREFWTHINGLVEKGVTIVVTTHFMDEAEYCDRIALVFRGRIIASGTPDQLKQQVVSSSLPEPSMEDAFIELVQRQSLTNAT